MKNLLDLEFTKIDRALIFKDDILTKYQDEKGYFDTNKYSRELSILRINDVDKIRNLFISYNNIEQLLNYLASLITFSKDQEEIYEFWLVCFKKQVENDREIIEENFRYKIAGYETDFRKKESYKCFLVMSELKQFFGRITYEITKIHKHFKDITEKSIIEMPKDHYFENDDFVYAFFQVCKSHNIIKRKGSEQEVSDTVILGSILNTFDLKKPNKMEFYSSETVKTNFVSKRTNNGKNGRYSQYLKKIEDVLKSVS